MIPSGRIVACDPFIAGGEPFRRSLAPGSYPLALAVAQIDTDSRIAFAIVRFAATAAAAWEPASIVQNSSNQENDVPESYGVDSATGCFCNPAVLKTIHECFEADIGFSELLSSKMNSTAVTTRSWLHLSSPVGSAALFTSGYGDGRYSSYFGIDAKQNTVALVTDFGVVNWPPGSRETGPVIRPNR